MNDEELRLFKRFVHSKHFNQHKKVVNLFELIRPKLRYVTFELSKLDAFNHLFPKQSYNDKKIRDVMSYLYTVLEKYLAFSDLHRKESSELISLSRSYRQRQLWKQFDTTVKRTSKILENSPVKDMNFHYQSYQLEQERYFALIDKKRSTETNLQQVVNSLDVSYFANRLRQTCSMLSHKNVFKTEYDLGIIEEIIKEVKRKELFRIPAIGIYYYVFLALSNADNPKHFKELQRELSTNGHLFDKEEMKDIYLLVINSRIRHINQDRHDLMSETLELYKAGIEKGYLLTAGQISRFTYENTITVALGLEQFTWAKDFLERYKGFLDPIYQKETYHKSLAKLNYAEQNYDLALQYLMTTALSDDVYINFDTKILMAKIYFEQGNIDALDSLVSNFQVFIRRKQTMSYHRILYQNFINSLKKLSLLNQFDRKAVLGLTNEIELLNPLPEKDWFLKQLSN